MAVRVLLVDDDLKLKDLLASYLEQNEVDGSSGQMPLGLAHARDMRHHNVVRSLFPDHLAQEPRVSRIVLDQQESQEWGLSHSSTRLCGSFTFVSQKSLTLWMRLSNASSCTGFAR